jgi:hypothetical protein
MLAKVERHGFVADKGIISVDRQSLAIIKTVCKTAKKSTVSV